MEAHLALTQPTQVNKVTNSCEICSGPHNTQYCMEDLEQAFVEYASSRTNEAGVPPSSDTKVVCTKGDDGEVVFIKLTRKNDDSNEGQPEEKGSTTTKEPRWENDPGKLDIAPDSLRECSSCGTLYTRDCSCSKGNVEDKILVPEPLKNCAMCAKCGHPVNGPYCQGCALLREKLEEDLIPVCCDDDDDYDSAITPVLSTEETDNSLSMRDEHLDTISETKSDEVIKSSVEDLVLIPSESEGIPDTMCDVHLVNNPTPLEAKDHFKIFMNSNNDISSNDDDSLYNENIEYVETSPYDSEVVSLETAEIVILEEEEIEDDNLREKLLNCPPTDDFTHKEFADKLAHIISPPDIPENLKTLAKGFYPPSLNFLSFNWESCIQILSTNVLSYVLPNKWP
nr:MAK10-like protein [Tanacetum cinerariifolium]